MHVNLSHLDHSLIVFDLCFLQVKQSVYVEYSKPKSVKIQHFNWILP